MKNDYATALTALTTDTYLPLTIFRKSEEFQTVILAILVKSTGIALCIILALVSDMFIKTQLLLNFILTQLLFLWD